MTNQPFDMTKARVLITNDDGIYAPGLGSLRQVAEQLFGEVWVVAPDRQQSGASHSLTMHKPLRIKRMKGDRHFCVDGTPTDCVMLAIKHIMRDTPPDLVLSGINNGINLGEDVFYSGTVAAAVEANMLGIPAIAFSLEVDMDQAAKWRTGEVVAEKLLQRLCTHGWPRDTLLNVNIPNLLPGELKGVRAAVQGKRNTSDQIVENIDPRGKPYYWIGPWGDVTSIGTNTDLQAVHEGYVSITPLHIDLTHTPAMRQLQEIFK